MRRQLLACAALASIGLAGCGDEAGNGQANITANAAEADKGLAVVEDSDGLSTAGKLLKEAGLEMMLTGPGSYTVFAPSDDAFGALPEDQRKLLESEEGRPQLLALLRQHITAGYVTPGDLTTALEHARRPEIELASLGAAPIPVRKQGDTVLLGQGDTAARVVGGAVPIANSIVYRIDRILPPPGQ